MNFFRILIAVAGTCMVLGGVFALLSGTVEDAISLGRTVVIASAIVIAASIIGLAIVEKNSKDR